MTHFSRAAINSTQGPQCREAPETRLRQFLECYGPVMSGDQVAQATHYGRTKRFEMKNTQNDGGAPEFPEAFTLSDAPNARALYWTDTVVAFIEAQANKARSGGTAS